MNARWGQFYRNTAATLESAYVRPRFNGYIRFQTEASALLRDCFTDKTNGKTAIAALNAGHAYGETAEIGGAGVTHHGGVQHGEDDSGPGTDQDSGS